MISVVVTVGPNPAYKKYLWACLESIMGQETSVPFEIVLIDDAAHLDIDPSLYEGLKYFKNDWNCGQACSQNRGVVNASYDWIFMMGGSDDMLLPGCLEACWQQAQTSGQRFSNVYYHPKLETSDGEVGTLPQGVGLFHRDLWYRLGGCPREAIAEVDAMFLSLALKKGVVMWPVGDHSLYWHREHSQSLGHNKSYARHEAAGILRGVVTQEWEDPEYWVSGYRKES